jgi:fructoselysine-6-P-deglycase FrlB-like protein
MDLNTARRSMDGYLQELSQVPEKLVQLCQFVEKDGKFIMREVARQIRSRTEIFVFGMASSQWAAWPLVFGLEHFGIRIHYTSAYQGAMIPLSRFKKNSLVLLISQSGETIEITKLLERFKDRSNRPFIVGVTNYLKSPLGEEADKTLDILAGLEIHAPSKTYVNTVALLVLLYFYVTIDDSLNPGGLIHFLLAIASKIKTYQESFKEWGKENAEIWSNYRTPIQFLAIGPQMASGWQSSMLCSETARIFSAVLDWATFRHGFEPQVNQTFVAIGFKPTCLGIWDTTIKSICSRLGHLLLVPDINVEDIFSQDFQLLRTKLSFISPIWETLPIHWFCINSASLKGLDASQLERKVTKSLDS